MTVEDLGTMDERNCDTRLSPLTYDGTSVGDVFVFSNGERTVVVARNEDLTVTLFSLWSGRKFDYPPEFLGQVAQREAPRISHLFRLPLYVESDGTFSLSFEGTYDYSYDEGRQDVLYAEYYGTPPEVNASAAAAQALLTALVPEGVSDRHLRGDDLSAALRALADLVDAQK